ncbi:molybdate ABC transporter substrate-binding protein [Pedobacter metabolipauper]|uniref:Molybdate transport system substrate-binding protein n=1 Tax=Pedobacter metabolipauper TaxID=425513 RepID=A0A4V3D1H8_9SPHI|nr:molybdate ABC transporter substrate-binding protein [Pedobacter metabolipauper]TDQ11273.1 molybdate transport system substrate-binding protein [Pedobacter metabolipauper]
MKFKGNNALLMLKELKIICLGIFCCLIFHGQLYAQTLRIAVAANAQGVIKKLQADFKKRTGIETEAIIGASGKLTAQIMNGAPYDVFLSADTEFPEKLFAAGFGLKKPKIYALGSLIICGNIRGDISNWKKLIISDQAKKVAIANPKTAPYGKAAEEALRFYSLMDQVKSRLVYGESISQVNTYLQTGTVSIGFTTEAFLYENNNKSLKWARIDKESYDEIAQGAILLAYAKKGKLTAASKFFDYLSTDAARKIISSSGYHVPLNPKK